jgi:hypothetical protein
MTRRSWIILAAIVVIALGAELAVRFWSSSSKGCVQIVNQGDHSMEDLVVRYGASKIKVGRLQPGASANVWLTVGKPGRLILEFSQKGNPLKGFPIDGYDPEDNKRNGVKLVLAVQNGRIERFVDDDESGTEVGTLIDRVKAWMLDDAQAPP